MTIPSEQSVDAAIVGGGIAGLWLYRLLLNSGYRVIVLEQTSLGCDQTLASQGMIHGGLKYALGGSLTGASEAIADMPERWRECLCGNGPVDLSGLPLLSDNYYMFAARSGFNRLTSFFASKALRGRISKVKDSDLPAAFEGFDGVAYALNDFVIDTRALLERLVGEDRHTVFQAEAGAARISKEDDGYAIRLDDTTIRARHLISCAGNGSATLLNDLGVPGQTVQQRPLQQVIVRPRHQAELFGHCLTGVTSSEPRLTITTHRTASGVVWYLGGRIATAGVERTADEQITFARRELDACLGWLDWTGAEIETLWVDRAEPLQTGGRRPDEAYAEKVGRFIQAFPTKLTLAPDLGDRVLALLPAPAGYPAVVSEHATAAIGQSPW